MKAVVITRYGGPEVLELREVPEPQPKPGQVVVRVEACGVNFADILTARGGYPGTPEPPLVAGREFAGTRQDTGEHVMGYTQSKAFAEKIAVSPQQIWPAPKQWSAAEAAAFPVNYFTAYFAYWKAGLVEDAKTAHIRQQRADVGHPKDSKRVLIQAVAGGVGTAAVEIGAILGMEMFGTSSSDEKLARAKELGLQHGINYTREDYEQRIRELTGEEGVDAVFEMLGGEHVTKGVRCLRRFGTVISYGSASGQHPTLDARILYEKQTSVQGLWLGKLSQDAQVMGAAWERLSGWVAAGQLHPVIGQTLPLERAADGFRLMLERKNYGKIVLALRA
ncbi:MAG: quinone oxidoreductase family protein [Terriglobales bacterium]